MNESSEILLKNSIHDFGLPIGLRVVSRTHAESRPTQTEKFTPERTQEDWVSVGDDTPQKPVMLTDDINEQ